MQRAYHGDHPVEDDLAERLAALLAVEDGESAPNGHRYQVSEATLGTCDGITLVSLPEADLGPAPVERPWGPLGAGAHFPSAISTARLRQVVEVQTAGRELVDDHERGELWHLLRVTWGTA